MPCPASDSFYLAYLVLLDPPARDKLRARVQAKIKSAEEDEDGCLLLPKIPSNKYLDIKTPCPLGCNAVYKQGGANRKDTSGHKVAVRLCVLIKLIQVYDTSGKDAALTFANQSKTLEVSHLCRARSSDLCVDINHFELELHSTNSRRTIHQNGNSVCDCAEHGDRPCLTNGSIGKKVFDDEGAHVGWKSAKGKRQKRSDGSGSAN